MFVRGSGIRDISFILCISIKKVLKILTTSIYHVTPKRKRRYDALEIDEFWTYVESKKNKLWLIADLQSDAYHRASGTDQTAGHNRENVANVVGAPTALATFPLFFEEVAQPLESLRYSFFSTSIMASFNPSAYFVDHLQKLI
jgi:hypothetical protein